jgi:SNF2 family DNA or RNA helicase
MIILHAAAVGNQLLLWGESPLESQPGPGPGAAPGTRKRGRRGGSSQAQPAAHRFDAGAAGLTAALGEGVPGIEEAPSARAFAPWIAWVPSTSQGALPSSPLLSETPEVPGESPSLRPWTVTALPVATERALAVLLAAGRGSTLAPGIIVGPTLAFWCNVLRFAGALVARQQFLPGVEEVAGEDQVESPTTYNARWEPVVAGADQLLLTRLVQAMPHGCRALAQAPAESPPAVSAQAVVSGVLGTLVDHLVRSSVAQPVLLPVRSGESTHDRWIQALRRGESRIEGKPEELAQLAEQVGQWRHPIEIAAAAPFRLCFRLEEPDHDDQPWQTRYLLQAADDPSLLIPVSTAWNPRGDRATLLERGGFRPREYLLATLGQAAAISPRIEKSLKAATPGGYETDAGGAHEFLTETAAMLEQAGFGVFLPAWWSKRGTRLHLAARAVVESPKLRASSSLSLEEILNFQWRVALGDQLLTYEELQALARLKAPLVKLRGQWVQLSAEEIQAALAFWKAKGASPITAHEVVRMALGDAQVPGGLAFEGIEADGWIRELLDQLQGTRPFEELEPAPGFQGTLRPYQVRGYSWLGFLRRWGLGACLADDMGLGKTVQTLALIQREWQAQPPATPTPTPQAKGKGKARSKAETAAAPDRRPTLLICPMSVVGNWFKEAARFTPDLPVMVHHGQTRIRGSAFQKEAAKNALVLSSYALLHRDLALFQQVPWAGVVLDEAQNIKNPQTKQAQAARAIKAGWRLALTGTPVENHVGDLWSIMEFLNSGWLGSQAQFKRSFHVPIQVERDPEAAQQLQRLTGPFILRRLKTDKSIIADLPEKLEMKVFCPLTKEQATLYEAVVAEASSDLDSAGEEIQRKGVVLATLAKLKQVCNHPAQFLHDNSAIPGRSGKLARLTEMLEETLEAGDRALVFSQFAEMGGLLRRHLQEAFGREVLFLHGGVPKAQRDVMVERFQSSNGNGTGGGPPIFILSLKAGGTGLNLTAASHVFHFDRWWNPAVENQATDRAFRIGQKQRVQVHKFLCVGTLEEQIDAMIERKQEVAGMTVGSGEDWLTRLSNEELKQVFKLRREALAE